MSVHPLKRGCPSVLVKVTLGRVVDHLGLVFFLQILEMILFYGNYMNAGGRNAMSIGFEMKDLLKLANTKTGMLGIL